MGLLKQKFKEILMSVIPIVFIVFIIHLLIVPLPSDLLIRFILGVVLIIIGLTLFLLGVDLGIAPLGSYLGERIVKLNKLWVVVVAGLILGFVMTIAEPGLLVYANQIQLITGGLVLSSLLLWIVAIGISVLLVVGFIRIIYNLPLHIILTLLYGIVMVLAVFTQVEFINIAFDASGATTGVLAVPFILSLAYGVSHLKKDSSSGEQDAFGTIAIVSVGAIISVLILNIVSQDVAFVNQSLIVLREDTSIFNVFAEALKPALKDTAFAMIPLLLILGISQGLVFKMRFSKFMHIFKGFIYVFLGLFLFLIGVMGGFIDVGAAIGTSLIANEQYSLFLLIAFFIGVVTILAEPAVHVLTRQIEDITAGYISKNAVLISMSLGVGIAVFLSALRVFIEPLQVWHLLLPGYIIAVILMYIVPKIFVGMAYDAGGVATGPMTATFILAFMYGATGAYPNASILLDGLGTIALVALTPIITLQVLGLLYKVKNIKGGIDNVNESR